MHCSTKYGCYEVDDEWLKEHPHRWVKYDDGEQEAEDDDGEQVDDGEQEAEGDDGEAA